MRRSIQKLFICAALAALPAIGGCGSDGSSRNSDPEVPPVTEPAPTVPTFSVKDTSGAAVEGATVYAIPVADVEALGTQAITLINGNYTAEALKVDEPLEDLINGNFTPAGGGLATYQSGVTDAEGKVELADLATGETDKFFIYVAPAAGNTGLLPGGSLCREAVTGASLDDKVTAVEISTQPSAAATFVGTSACLTCHEDKADFKKTMHRNGFMAPGAPSGLQDVSKFDADDAEYDLGKALDKYTAGNETSGGTTIWFYDYDGTRKFDKFKTLESDPRLNPTAAKLTDAVYATVRIYSNGGKYYAQFTNVINSEDPNSGMTHEVVLTYGGGIYKQRPMTKIDDNLFLIPLQFNARGDDASGDRVRKIWRDYHLDWWWNAAGKTFKAKPAAKVSVDVQCAPCHFNGFTLTDTGIVDAGGVDNYFQATGVADANGEMHPVTGTSQELNIGCETCHGPGSEHVAAEGKGKAIVTPKNITPERENMLCGQCHSRPQGNGTYKNDSPLDANNKMMLAGTSRTDFLANNVSRQDAATGDFWGDGLHSKSHHQQYTDFIQTPKYRNGANLLTCSSCHDLHAPGTDRHQLSGASDGTLCLSCHGEVVSGAHQMAKTGSSLHSSGPAKCIECHNAKVSTSGAGSNPTTAKSGGTSGKKYYQGDISSHLFDVPSKADTSADNQMPVPYTLECGACHNLSTL